MRNQVHRGSLLSSVRPISSPPRHSSCKSRLCHSLLDIGYTASTYAAPFHFHVAPQNAGLPTDMATYPLKHVFLTGANGFVASHTLSHSSSALQLRSALSNDPKRKLTKHPPTSQHPSSRLSLAIVPRHHRASPLSPTHSRTQVHPSTQSYTSRRHSCLAPCPQT
jgi:hypothetical protein